MAIMLSISCREEPRQFDKRDLALAAAKRSQGDLRRKVKTWIELVFQARAHSVTAPANVQNLVDRYADHVCADAAADLQKFLPLAGVPATPGGLPTHSVVLAFPRKGLLPNQMSLGALGEAVAGWYMRDQKQMWAICRPVGKPDLVFRKAGRYCLVGVKASLTPTSLTAVMAKDAVDLLQEVSAAKYRMASKFLVYVIGVVLRGPTDFDLYALALEET